MDIPPLALASDSAKKIFMREATVDETIQFAEADPAREELCTTLFLNKVQKPENYIDSQLWTGDDRRLMLLWYWLHTHKDDTTVAPSYLCKCGEYHTPLIDMAMFTKTYRPMQGKAEREDTFNGRKIITRPLKGADLEEIELHLIGADSAEKGELRALMRKVTVLETVLLFSFGDIPLADKEKDPGMERREKEKFVRNMGWSDFEAFRLIMAGRITEMEHGIETVYEDGRVYLLTDYVECPKDKEVKTRLRLPFRSSA